MNDQCIGLCCNVCNVSLTLDRSAENNSTHIRDKSSLQDRCWLYLSQTAFPLKYMHILVQPVHEHNDGKRNQRTRIFPFSKKNIIFVIVQNQGIKQYPRVKNDSEFLMTSKKLSALQLNSSSLPLNKTNENITQIHTFIPNPIFSGSNKLLINCNKIISKPKTQWLKFINASKIKCVY